MNQEKMDRVLIVDDNKKLCKNLADILGAKGYKVSAVYDGQSAIEQIKKNKYCMALMDVKMPGMSGIDALKIIKEIQPDINIIMITAFADDVFLTQGLNDIKFEIIQKPFDIDMLLALLEKYC